MYIVQWFFYIRHAFHSICSFTSYTACCITLKIMIFQHLLRRTLIEARCFEKSEESILLNNFPSFNKFHLIRTFFVKQCKLLNLLEFKWKYFWWVMNSWWIYMILHTINKADDENVWTNIKNMNWMHEPNWCKCWNVSENEMKGKVICN